MKIRISQLQAILTGVFLFPCPTILHAQGAPGGLPVSGTVATDPAAQQIASALSLLQLGSIEEARQCVSVLEAAQSQNPGMTGFGDVRNLIMSIFRAEAGVIAARKALVEAKVRAGQLERNAKMASEVSPLTGRSNSEQAGRYRDQANQLTSEADGFLQQSKASLASALVDARARLLEAHPGAPRDFIQRIADRNEVELPALVKTEGTIAGETQVVGGIEFVWCPPGEFLMGSPPDEEGRSDDEEQVRVTISRGFWLGKTEVTQEQWEAVMGDNPSQFIGKDLPVENLSWEDAMNFVKKVNESRILPPGWKLTLPTEAQWEYACRAGTSGAYAGSLDEMAWYGGYKKNPGETHPVGQKKPNSAGLYDMQGNVEEWCLDCYEVKLPGGEDPVRTSGSKRVLRGGGWLNDAEDCRSAYRLGLSPDYRRHDVGFRVAVSFSP
jgi:formylglycine-generating enzyme required for sulfatase activity